MNMKLFEENERFTQDAIDFDREISRAIEPIFDKYVAQGARARELENIATGAVYTISLSRIIGI